VFPSLHVAIRVDTETNDLGGSCFFLIIMALIRGDIKSCS